MTTPVLYYQSFSQILSEVTQLVPSGQPNSIAPIFQYNCQLASQSGKVCVPTTAHQIDEQIPHLQDIE
jgi:hypothetical protein